MTWQIAGVVVIEALALGFLVLKVWPRRPRALRKPDVKASQLVQKSRRKAGGCHDG